MKTDKWLKGKVNFLLCDLLDFHVYTCLSKGEVFFQKILPAAKSIIKELQSTNGLLKK